MFTCVHTTHTFPVVMYQCIISMAMTCNNPSVTSSNPSELHHASIWEDLGASKSDSLWSIQEILCGRTGWQIFFTTIREGKWKADHLRLLQPNSCQQIGILMRSETKMGKLEYSHNDTMAWGRPIEGFFFSLLFSSSISMWFLRFWKRKKWSPSNRSLFTTIVLNLDLMHEMPLMIWKISQDNYRQPLVGPSRLTHTDGE